MPQPVGRYVYWSQRLVRDTIDHNGIRLDARVKAALNVGVAGNGVSLTGRDRENTTFDVAETLKKKLRKSIATDLDESVSGRLVQGEGWVEIAEFQRWGFPEHQLPGRTAVTHAQTVDRHGHRVDLCLFGSLKNLVGYAIPEDDSVGGWTSSNAPLIEEFLALRGAATRDRTGDFYDLDDQALAVEALKVALSQGIYSHPADHRGRPETRAFTVMGFDATEYVILVYRDVMLTPSRWNFRTEPEMLGASRIIIGAPLWLRTTRQETIRTYFGENRVAIPRRLGTRDAPSIAPTRPAGQALPQLTRHDDRMPG